MGQIITEKSLRKPSELYKLTVADSRGGRGGGRSLTPNDSMHLIIKWKFCRISGERQSPLPRAHLYPSAPYSKILNPPSAVSLGYRIPRASNGLYSAACKCRRRQKLHMGGQSNPMTDV